MGASQQSDRQDLESRVHIDLPRVLPEDMGTTQYVEPTPDPQEGRDANSEFMLRNAGVSGPDQTAAPSGGNPRSQFWCATR